MRKQSVKRINLFLTAKEVRNLEELECEMKNRGLNLTVSDIIRDAINEYAARVTATASLGEATFVHNEKRAASKFCVNGPQ